MLRCYEPLESKTRTRMESVPTFKKVNKKKKQLTVVKFVLFRTVSSGSFVNSAIAALISDLTCRQFRHAVSTSGLFGREAACSSG